MDLLNAVGGMFWVWFVVVCDLNNDGLFELIVLLYGRALNYFWCAVLVMGAT